MTHLVIQDIIPESQLKDLDKAIEYLEERDYNKDIVKNIEERFKDDDRLPQDQIKELVKYAVYTQSDSDNTFIIDNYDLCTGCGNCCSQKKGIYLKDTEYERLPEHLKPMMEPSKDDKKYYQIIETLPCMFLTKDNRCTIYKHRPSGCVAYPLVEMNGALKVVRDINCGFIMRFFEIKTDMFIQKILLTQK